MEELMQVRFDVVKCPLLSSFPTFAVSQVLATMLIRTCFLFACLPVASHVWGRGGQGKEPSALALGGALGASRGVWLPPGRSSAPALAVVELQAAHSYV